MVNKLEGNWSIQPGSLDNRLIRVEFNNSFQVLVTISYQVMAIFLFYHSVGDTDKTAAIFQTKSSLISASVCGFILVKFMQICCSMCSSREAVAKQNLKANKLSEKGSAVSFSAPLIILENTTLHFQ